MNKTVKEFLIYGELSENDSNSSIPQFQHDRNSNVSVSLICTTSKLLAAKSIADSQINAIHKFSQNLHQIENQITADYDRIYKNHYEKIEEMITSYLKLKLKIHHMNLYVIVMKLKETENIIDIPDMIFNMVQEVPPNLLMKPSKIKQIVDLAIKEMKTRFLEHFHRLFEEHLSDSEKFSSEQQEGKVIWNSFLSNARDWLLAYTVIALLPSILSGSKNSILERYHEVMDEAFTPIWGRFHYHLSMAREAKSQEQILWTFSYTKSFVAMLCDLSDQLTSSGQLKRLCAVDYRKVGLKMVIDKAIRFLRAHVAVILSDVSNTSSILASQASLIVEDSSCIQLVEEVLELDHVFAETLSSALSDDNTHYSIGSTICSVIFDKKEVFIQWIESDFQHCKAFLKENFQDYHHAFSLPSMCSQFSSENMSFSGVEQTEDNSKFQNSNWLRRCYVGVYSALTLFFQTTQRYQYLPEASQLLISEFILEPLLVSILSLFLYRIRSHAILFAVSEDNIKNVYEFPEDYKTFRCSVHYFQTSLSTIHNSKIISRFKASSMRLKKRWREIQSWMPRALIIIPKKGMLTSISSDSQPIHHSLTDMVDVALKSSPISYNERIKKAYFNNDSQSNQTVEGSIEITNISDCVDTVRAYALTLVNVLDNNFNK
eukprot:gene14194-19047_t